MRLITLLTIILILTGCNTMPKAFKTICNPCISVERYYDTLREVEAICGKGNNGCWQLRSGVNFIYTIKSQCVLDHEREHMNRGSFHDMAATCKVRY